MTEKISITTLATMDRLMEQMDSWMGVMITVILFSVGIVLTEHLM